MARLTPPFDALAGVQLGMTARALRVARPNLAVVQYAGYREAVDGYSVLYLVEDRLTTLGGGGNGRLEVVEAVARAGDGFDPDSIWEHTLRETSHRFGTPPQCYDDPRTMQQTRLAVWGAGRYVLYAKFVAPLAAMNRVAEIAVPDTISGQLAVGVAPRAALLGGRELIPGQHPTPADCRAPQGLAPTVPDLRR